MRKNFFRLVVLAGAAVAAASPRCRPWIAKPFLKPLGAPGAHMQLSDETRGAGFRTLFALEKAQGIGGGAAISPDGKLLAYVAENTGPVGQLRDIYGTDGKPVANVGGGNRGIYVRNLDSGQTRPLISEVYPGLDAFYDPDFSADGKRLLFTASGGTWYYPSDIYSIGTDGVGFQRLTDSRGSGESLPSNRGPGGGPVYRLYYGAGFFSPDGGKILVGVTDESLPESEDHDRVALMNPDGSHFERAAEGRPRFWSAEGDAFYYETRTGLCRFDLRSRQSQPVTGLRPHSEVLGKLADRDVLLVKEEGRIKSFILEVNGTAATPGGPDLGVPTERPGRAVRAHGSKRSVEMVLRSIESSRTGRLVLEYDGGVGPERLEVIQPVQ